MAIDTPTSLDKTGSGHAKLGTVIAEKIEQQIVRAGWSVGTVLATEAELADQFGVSRATIREAVGQIERRGIATMRRGNRGGLVVTAPARASVVRALATYMELANADFEQMLDARLLLELRAATLACERIDARGIQLLRARARQLSLRTGSIEDDTRAHTAFRETIAEASGNPLLSLLIEAMDFSTKEVMLVNTDDPHIYDDIIAQTIKIKQDLVEAIADFDAVSALQLVQRDVALQLSGHRRKRTPPPSPGRRPAHAEGVKLPHALAMLISQHIRLNHWPTGQKIGSENELIKEYGVSRSAFREAIRLLESLSVVKTQRGGGGGLVVGEPDPTHTIESAARYIDYMGLLSAHMHEVREALELGAVQLAARAATAEDIQEMRRALYVAETATTPEDLLFKPIAVHLAMCRAGHNQVISLLTQLVLRVVSNTYEPQRLSIEMVREVGTSHARIVNAIIARDSGMAKRGMFQHLMMIQKWTNLRGQTILKKTSMPEASGATSN